MVSMVKQHFVQASSIKDFAAFCEHCAKCSFSSGGSCSYSSSVINTVPIIQGNRVSLLRDCSQGSEASSTATAIDSRLLFLTEFLETRIGAQGIPERIKP
jgi:hypothetical protein